MSGTQECNVLFHEVQEFRRLWSAFLIFPGSLALIVIFAFGMYRQLGRGVPFGSDPMPDGVLWFLGPFMILLGCFLIFIFLSMRLVTTVRGDGVYLRYVPFVDRFIDFRDIVKCEARTYHPFREYGGWGIRGGRRRRAYNVRGNRGVQLTFRDGSSLLIGSQRAEELERAILQMM
jgi:hypothetical protein